MAPKATRTSGAPVVRQTRPGDVLGTVCPPWNYTRYGPEQPETDNDTLAAPSRRPGTYKAEETL